MGISVRRVGEYSGTSTEPNDESILLDMFHFRTYESTLGNKYVEDLSDGTFTAKDICLNSLEEVVKHENKRFLDAFRQASREQQMREQIARDNRRPIRMKPRSQQSSLRNLPFRRRLR